LVDVYVPASEQQTFKGHLTLPPSLSLPQSAVALPSNVLTSGHANALSMTWMNVQFEMHTDKSQFALPKPQRPAFVQQLLSGHGFDGSHCLFCCRLCKKALMRDSPFEEVGSCIYLLLFKDNFFAAAVPLLCSEPLPALLLSKTLSM
jgi:hypothetical protein